MDQRTCSGLQDPSITNSLYEQEMVKVFIQELHRLPSDVQGNETSPFDSFKLERIIWDIACVSRPGIFHKSIIILLRMIASNFPTPCSNTSNISKIMLLIEACPATLYVADESGNLILHWACQYNASLTKELFESLIYYARDSSGILNYYHTNCLDTLIKTHCSLGIIELMIKTCPICLRTGTDKGHLPIHSLVNEFEYFHLDGGWISQNFEKLLRMMLDVDPELLFCDVQEERFRLTFGEDGQSQTIVTTETWSTISRARMAGHERLKMAVDNVLCRYATSNRLIVRNSNNITSKK